VPEFQPGFALDLGSGKDPRSYMHLNDEIMLEQPNESIKVL
jgi:hypothetical protein